MGLLNPRVKKRTEALIRHDARFEKEVVEWQERLAPLNTIADVVPAPVDLKARVLKGIQTSATHSTGLGEQFKRWFASVFLWQSVALASMAAIVMLLTLPMNPSTLWAVERETGNVLLLSKLDPDTQRINLTAAKWKAVQNSFELVVVAGDDFKGAVLLRGICLQLAGWAA